jgi:hypothetical protein
MRRDPDCGHALGCERIRRQTATLLKFCHSGAVLPMRNGFGYTDMALSI